MYITQQTCLQSILAHTDPPATGNFFVAYEAHKAKALSSGKAAAEALPTTVLTLSTTQPMVLEAAAASTSMCAHRVVGQRAATVRKGQGARRWNGPCSVGWWIRTQRCRAGDSAPC